MITKAIHKIQKSEDDLVYLSAWERIDIAKQKEGVERRLSGRVAAKKALAVHLGGNLQFADIRINNTSSGAPVFSVSGKSKAAISIAHTGHYGIAAVADVCEGRIGVDIERSDRFSRELRDKFTTEREAQWVRSSAGEKEQQVRAAFLWCIKEAYTKALGVGLKKDPRRIEIADPSMETGGMVIVDEGQDVPCYLFWSMAYYYNHVIVGLSI